MNWNLDIPLPTDAYYAATHGGKPKWYSDSNVQNENFTQTDGGDALTITGINNSGLFAQGDGDDQYNSNGAANNIIVDGGDGNDIAHVPLNSWQYKIYKDSKTSSDGKTADSFGLSRNYWTNGPLEVLKNYEEIHFLDGDIKKDENGDWQFYKKGKFPIDIPLAGELDTLVKGIQSFPWIPGIPQVGTTNFPFNIYNSEILPDPSQEFPANVTKSTGGNVTTTNTGITATGG